MRIELTGTNRGPITNEQASRTCTLAGVGHVGQKLVTLKEIERGILASEAELTRAMEKKAIVDTALLGLKWTKAACDGFMSIASELSAPTGGGKALGKGYEIVSALAEGDLKKAIAVTAGASARGPGEKSAIKVFSINVDIIHGAMKQDSAAIYKGLYDMKMEVGKMSLTYLEKKTAKKVLTIGKTLIDSGLSMHKSYEQFQKERASTQETLRSGKKMFSDQLQSIRNRIYELEDALQSCVVAEPLILT